MNLLKSLLPGVLMGVAATASAAMTADITAPVSAADLSAGEYLIYNSRGDLEGDGQCWGFRYASGTSVAGSHGTKLSAMTACPALDDTYVWVLEGAAEGKFYVKNKATGTYITHSGNNISLSATPLAWGVRTYVSEHGVTYPTAVSVFDDAVCWDGNATAMAGWNMNNTTGQPHQFFRWVEGEGGGGGETPVDPNVINLPDEPVTPGAEILALSALTGFENITAGWGTPQRNKSIDGNPITMKGKTYTSGVGTHVASDIVVKLNGAVTRFHTEVGMDDEQKANFNKDKHSQADFKVTLVGQDRSETIVKSGDIKGTDASTVTIDIDDLGNAKYLILHCGLGTDGTDWADHVDWGNAYFEYVEQNSTRPEIVSPEALNGTLLCATRVFSQPGVRFMHKLRAADTDATITVTGLPEGLTFNAKRCLVEGIVEQEGDYTYTVNVDDTPETIFLTVSSKLHQPVPFMGWLSWNVVQGEISNTVIETVADAFVSQGLLDAGYNYLVIDDLWHASSRGAGNVPVEDPAKFPKGMKAAADYAHSKGLKFGIYSDAGSATCAGKFGSYGYETIDANQYAKWGVDLLKYDYCNVGGADDAASAKVRYKAMGDALQASGRDILFYMCEWGVREPWKWATETGATCWRATYDTRDGWKGKGQGIGMVQSVAGMQHLWPYSGVNRFNDADMMCVGIHGTGKSSSDLVDGTPGMTQTEYRSQFAMWCMWSSPLTLSFDLRKKIEEDDLALMTNADLIAIDQDRMGQQAEYLGEDENQCQLYVKDLENGDVAVAVINMSASTHPYVIDFSKIAALNADELYTVRDLQKQQDMDDATGSISCSVASHETKVYRLAVKNAGIQAVGAAASQPSVKAANGIVTVTCPASEGVSKRVLVSDVEGRVLASATSVDEVITIPVNASGVVLVNTIAAGRTHTAKVTL